MGKDFLEEEVRDFGLPASNCPFPLCGWGGLWLVPPRERGVKRQRDSGRDEDSEGGGGGGRPEPQETETDL